MDPCIVDTWSGDHQSWHQVLALSLCIKSLHQATSLAIKYWWLSDKSNDAFDKNFPRRLELTTYYLNPAKYTWAGLKIITEIMSYQKT